MKDFFGKTITRKAISRHSQNEIYKRKHYNIIPCSCPTKKHDECDGMWFDKHEPNISHACKCKRHSRVELKDFKQWEGRQWV